LFSRRALILTQPISLVRWLNQLLLAALMSLIIGAIWWDVPGSDPQLLYSDRPGFHYAGAVLAPWPVLLLTLGEIGRERWSVHRDIRDRLYYRMIYFFTKVSYCHVTVARNFDLDSVGEVSYPQAMRVEIMYRSCEKHSVCV